jgi:hypothetical protein
MTLSWYFWYAQNVATASPTLASVSGMTQRINCWRRDAVSRPTLIPRKHAISTMFVKNVRKTTVLPNQRIAASSKNRIRKLIRNKSRYGRRGAYGDETTVTVPSGSSRSTMIGGSTTGAGAERGAGSGAMAGAGTGAGAAAARPAGAGGSGLSAIGSGAASRSAPRAGASSSSFVRSAGGSLC